MADDLVQINNNKENILEFDLSVDGLNANQVDAKFVIRGTDIDFAFPCVKDQSGKWSVKLPPLPMLERTAYPCHFQVIAEGYAFTPYKGSINVVGSNDVYITQPKSKFASPTQPKVVEAKPAPIEVPKVMPTKAREKGIAQIAQELMESHKKETTVASVGNMTGAVAPGFPPLNNGSTTVVNSNAPVTTSTVVVKENLLPKIEITPKKESHGSKDKATRDVLESMGIKTEKKKPKKRFSIKNK